MLWDRKKSNPPITYFLPPYVYTCIVCSEYVYTYNTLNHKYYPSVKKIQILYIYTIQVYTLNIPTRRKALDTRMVKKDNTSHIMVPTPNHKPQKKNTIFFFTLHIISVNIFIYIWDLVEWGRKKQDCNINHHFYIMTFSLWYMYIVLYTLVVYSNLYHIFWRKKKRRTPAFYFYLPQYT